MRASQIAANYETQMTNAMKAVDHYLASPATGRLELGGGEPTVSFMTGPASL